MVISPITEKEYIDKLIAFQENSRDFYSWAKVKSLQNSAVICATAQKKRSAQQFSRLLAIGLIAYLCYWLELDDLLINSDCLLPGSETLQDIFRPQISDCSYCQIDSIHIRNNLTDEEFYDKYAYTGIPLLVSDGMKGWNTDVFSFQYFKQLYHEKTEEDNKGCQFFPYRTDFNTLQDVFNMDADRAAFKPGSEPWYIGWSNCIPSVSKALRQHYKVPYFLGKSERTRDDWMFMGSPGYKGAPLHIDWVEYNSWQAQIRGRKKWTFEPPPECWYQCPHSHKVVVEPGNIFVFDSNRWFHSTEVMEGEYSLTIGAEYD